MGIHVLALKHTSFVSLGNYLSFFDRKMVMSLFLTVIRINNLVLIKYTVYIWDIIGNEPQLTPHLQGGDGRVLI